MQRSPISRWWPPKSTDIAVLSRITSTSSLSPAVWWEKEFVVLDFCPEYLWDCLMFELKYWPHNMKLKFLIVAVSCIYLLCLYDTLMRKALPAQSNPLISLNYEKVADVLESWIWLRADFQSGSRVLKKEFWTFSYLYLWHAMWFHAKKLLKTLKFWKSLNSLCKSGSRPQKSPKKRWSLIIDLVSTVWPPDLPKVRWCRYLSPRNGCF